MVMMTAVLNAATVLRLKGMRARETDHIPPSEMYPILSNVRLYM
jgi:hypothetical protein